MLAELSCLSFSLCLLHFGCVLSAPSYADEASYTAKPLISDANLGTLWAIDRLDSERLIFTEREGRLQIYNLASGKLQQVDISTIASEIVYGGQGGLFDVLVLSATGDQAELLLSYSKRVKSGICTTVVKARLIDASLAPHQSLFESHCGSNNKRHYGGRLALVGDKLFVSIGDGGNRAQAQNLQNHAGSIVRLNLDGSVPKDNPFVSRSDVLPEIYSYGHRNPQGLAFSAADNSLWAIEHGPRGGDELNLITAGGNYGWPKYSYGKEYWGPIAVGENPSPAGFIEPSLTYVPSIAPGDLAIRPGSSTVFIPALSRTHLSLVELGGLKAELKASWLTDKNMRLRSVYWLDNKRLLIGTDKQGVWQLVIQD